VRERAARRQLNALVGRHTITHYATQGHNSDSAMATLWASEQPGRSAGRIVDTRSKPTFRTLRKPEPLLRRTWWAGTALQCVAGSMLQLGAMQECIHTLEQCDVW